MMAGITEWFQFDPAWGLAGLAVFSFLSATLLPGGSEALLLAFLAASPEAVWPAVVVATAGNSLGGMVSWWCGQVLPRSHRLASVPRLEVVRRWGSPVLLFSWLPLVGDALCLAAGWLRLHWLPCLLFIVTGKAARYLLLAWAVLPN